MLQYQIYRWMIHLLCLIINMFVILWLWCRNVLVTSKWHHSGAVHHYYSQCVFMMSSDSHWLPVTVQITGPCRVGAAVWNSSGRLNSPLQQFWSQSGFYPDFLMAPWTRSLLGSAPSLGSKLDSPWWSCREKPELQSDRITPTLDRRTSSSTSSRSDQPQEQNYNIIAKHCKYMQKSPAKILSDD